MLPVPSLSGGSRSESASVDTANQFGAVTVHPLQRPGMIASLTPGQQMAVAVLMVVAVLGGIYLVRGRRS